MPKPRSTLSTRVFLSMAWWTARRASSFWNGSKRGGTKSAAASGTGCFTPFRPGWGARGLNSFTGARRVLGKPPGAGLLEARLREDEACEEAEPLGEGGVIGTELQSEREPVRHLDGSDVLVDDRVRRGGPHPVQAEGHVLGGEGRAVVEADALAALHVHGSLFG